MSTYQLRSLEPCRVSNRAGWRWRWRRLKSPAWFLFRTTAIKQNSSNQGVRPSLFLNKIQRTKRPDRAAGRLPRTPRTTLTAGGLHLPWTCIRYLHRPPAVPGPASADSAKPIRRCVFYSPGFFRWYGRYGETGPPCAASAPNPNETNTHAARLPTYRLPWLLLMSSPGTLEP